MDAGHIAEAVVGIAATGTALVAWLRERAKADTEKAAGEAARARTLERLVRQVQGSGPYRRSQMTPHEGAVADAVANAREDTQRVKAHAEQRIATLEQIVVLQHHEHASCVKRNDACEERTRLLEQQLAMHELRLDTLSSPVDPPGRR